MKAQYCGSRVVGASFPCTAFTCVIFLAATIMNIICSYGVFIKCTIAIYIPEAALCIAIIWMYMDTTLTDPGVMPKRSKRNLVTQNLQQQEKHENVLVESLKTSEENGVQLQESQPQVQEVQKDKVDTKVIRHQATNKISANFSQQPPCYTCLTEKPPGTAHCDECGHCVLYQDHHCPWLGTCIGLRNYYGFIKCCFMTFAYCLCVCIYNACGIYYQITVEHNDVIFGNNNAFVPVFILIVFTIGALFGFFFGLSMVCSHVGYIKEDFTTRAELRNRQNVPQSLQAIQHLGESRKEYVAQLIAEDPILKTLDLKKYTLSGIRRLMFGSKMPILRTMSVEQAEETAWRWTVVLGGFDDQ